MPTKLRDQLLEFHVAFGHYIRTTTVGVPPDDVVRLRARLIIEEAFEVLEAVFARDTLPHDNLDSMKKLAKSICATAPVDVDLPALADALGDTDYVVEGTRLAFGIDGGPIADAIHAANMAKLGGGKDEHGKSVKPAGWKQPDVAGELRKQGWKETPKAKREPRNLCEKIEQLLAVIPEDQVTLRTKLGATRDSADFAAPEVQSMWWNRSAELLREFVDPHVQLKTDWALRVVEVWREGT